MLQPAGHEDDTDKKGEYTSQGLNMSVTVNENDVSDTYIFEKKPKIRPSNIELSEGDVIVKRKSYNMLKIAVVILSIIIISGAGAAAFSLGAKKSDGKDELISS